MDFEINGIYWRIVFTSPTSDLLRRSDGSLTCGVTDENTHCVYLSDMLQGDFLRKVICHELVHCFMMSHSIHIPIEQEEFMASWISEYGSDLICLLDDLMQNLRYQVA